MNAETQQQLVAMLRELGDKFGPAGTQIWETAVRQVIISARVDLYTFAAMFLLWSVATTAAWFYERDCYEKELTTIMFFIGMFVLTCVGLVVIPASIQQLMNPEFFALKELAHTLR